MALISCIECRASISDSASACQQCGAKVPKSPIWPWFVGIPAALIAAIALWFSSIPEYERQANSQRRVCEDLIKSGLGRDRRICDDLHSNIIRQGIESEEIRKGLRTPSPTANSDLAMLVQSPRRACADNIEATKRKYTESMKKSDFKSAADSMRPCAKLLEDPFLQNMVSRADALNRSKNR